LPAVASLTDDALLRSRLQAQKDGTAVMDSKWLEIVGRCHRATSFCLSFAFSLALCLYLFWLSVASFISCSKFTARDVLLQEQTMCMKLHKILVYFFARLNFRSYEQDDIFKKQVACHTEYFIEYVHRVVQ